MKAAVLAIVWGLTPDNLSAETRWTMVRTPTLTVIGDQSAGTLRDIAVQLEQFRAVVGALFQNADRPLALPTTVFVFRDHKEASPFLPLYNGHPANVAGFFGRSDDQNVMVMALDNAAEANRIVYHEYTHLLIDRAVRSLPLWLHEGIAEYYSTYGLVDGGKAAEIGRPIAYHLRLLRDYSLPLAELIAIDRTSPQYNEGDRQQIYYSQCWALVHYLFNGMKGGPAAINAYAVASRGGAQPADAFRSAFGVTTTEFEQQLRNYTLRMTFSGRRFPFDANQPPPDVGPPRQLSNGEADGWLGDLQRRIGRDAEAAKRVEAAVAADPAAAAAHLALGLLRIQQKRTEEGLDALKHATDLAPDEFTTQFTRGVWMLRTAEGNVKAAANAIGPLTRATRLKPDSAEALAWLAAAQMTQPVTLPAARASIERAMALAPGQAAYEQRWIEIRARQGDGVEGKSLLAGDAVRPASERTPLNTGRVVPQLRKPAAGESRVMGILARVDCSSAEVRFEVKTLDRTVVATALRMEDVELISYLGTSDFSLTCGPRANPERVYLTSKPVSQPSAGRDGTAVALEFLPRDYQP